MGTHPSYLWLHRPSCVRPTIQPSWPVRHQGSDSPIVQGESPYSAWPAKTVCTRDRGHLQCYRISSVPSRTQHRISTCCRCPRWPSISRSSFRILRRMQNVQPLNASWNHPRECVRGVQRHLRTPRSPVPHCIIPRSRDLHKFSAVRYYC